MHRPPRPPGRNMTPAQPDGRHGESGGGRRGRGMARAVAAANPSENGFPLKGVISVASANQVAELNAHAASRSEVTLDMGKVSRIDFHYTGHFLDLVKTFQLANKRVILANLSEINAALLEAIGVNRYAILVRRRSS